METWKDDKTEKSVWRTVDWLTSHLYIIDGFWLDQYLWSQL